jgi:23S rRNA (adenine-N6)-dimethyltransferase
MSAYAGRTSRRERRRRLGQNFLRSEFADRLVAQADFRAGDFVLEIGPGTGAFTAALARRRVRVHAVELDPVLAARLRARPELRDWVRVVEGDFVSVPLPDRPFRAVGSLPFGRTTDVLRRLLDDPHGRLVRADVVVQWEVARKRTAVPPTSLLSAQWAPWWEFTLACRIPADAFTPVPRVDAGFVSVVRRARPLLPAAMVRPYAKFVRSHWPFEERCAGAHAFRDRARSGPGDRRDVGPAASSTSGRSPGSAGH